MLSSCFHVGLQMLASDNIYIDVEEKNPRHCVTRVGYFTVMHAGCAGLYSLFMVDL